MPLSLQLQEDHSSISIDEYVNSMRENKFNLSCHEDVIESAKYFKKLNNNKKFILDYLYQELKDFKSFQRNNFYGPGVLVLYKTQDYFLRAVVWNPLSTTEKLIKNFIYDICHDHNFDFLTAGYYGPGYKTRCYSYEYAKVKGLINEKIKLRSEGTITLSEDEVHFYRSKIDVHIQLPPEAMSISLNLMIKNHRKNISQFQIDEKTGKILRYLHSSNSEFVLKLAGVLGDSNVVDPLLTIFKKNENLQIKALAASSIIKIVPEYKYAIEKLVKDSRSSLLKDLYFRETIETLKNKNSTVRRM